MPVRNGLYKIDFETQRGGGQGVVYLRNGKIWGGDSGWYYIGTYEQDGDDFTASVTLKDHTKHTHITSALGVDEAEMTLKGVADGDAFKTKGKSKQAPGVTFVCKLSRLSD